MVSGKLPKSKFFLSLKALIHLISLKALIHLGLKSFLFVNSQNIVPN